ncbi:MAG: DUF58 domain-containing protein [Flavobacteriales bacterium]|nr:DUF58 domain-containing protein [Flavobacteriales bacterium]
MRLLRPIFLTNRVFYLLGFCITVFALGFSFSGLVYAGFLLLAMILVAVAVDIRSAQQLAQNIEVERKVAPHFSLSDSNSVKLYMKNGNGRPIQVRIIDEIPVQFQVRDFLLREELPANDERSIQYQLTPAKRGEFIFNSINILFEAPLGLVEYRKTIEQQQRVKVYPSFEQMQKFEMMAFNSVRQDEGIRRLRRIGHGYEFSDIRHYVIGDDPRSVNWKASSRMGELMVNNYEDERSQKVYAIIDQSRTMRMPFNGMSLMDYAINTSLAILNIALKNQDHSGLMSFSKTLGVYVPAQRKNNQLSRIMDALYNQESSTNEANYAELFTSIKTRIRNRSLLFLFTNFQSLNALKRVLPQLKRLNRDHLLVVTFFENTELETFRQEPIQTTLDMASKVMADKLSEELTQIVYELRTAGIQAIKTRPEDLTTNTVNKYLELKSRGLI